MTRVQRSVEYTSDSAWWAIYTGLDILGGCRQILIGQYRENPLPEQSTAYY